MSSENNKHGSMTIRNVDEKRARDIVSQMEQAGYTIIQIQFSPNTVMESIGTLTFVYAYAPIPIKRSRWQRWKQRLKR